MNFETAEVFAHTSFLFLSSFYQPVDKFTWWKRQFGRLFFQHHMTFLLFSLYDQLNIGVNDMKCIRFCSYSENKAFYSVSQLHMIFETPASGRYGPGCVNSKKSEFNTFSLRLRWVRHKTDLPASEFKQSCATWERFETLSRSCTSVGKQSLESPPSWCLETKILIHHHTPITSLKTEKDFLWVTLSLLSLPLLHFLTAPSQVRSCAECMLEGQDGMGEVKGVNPFHCTCEQWHRAPPNQLVEQVTAVRWRNWSSFVGAVSCVK